MDYFERQEAEKRRIEQIRYEHGEEAAQWEERVAIRGVLSVGSGAITGAQIGSLLGPVGTGVGMAVGYIAGAVSASGAKNPHIKK